MRGRTRRTRGWSTRRPSAARPRRQRSPRPRRRRGSPSASDGRGRMKHGVRSVLHRIHLLSCAHDLFVSWAQCVAAANDVQTPCLTIVSQLASVTTDGKRPLASITPDSGVCSIGLMYPAGAVRPLQCMHYRWAHHQYGWADCMGWSRGPVDTRCLHVD